MNRQEGIWLWLSLVRGMNARKAGMLLERFGTLDALFAASEHELSAHVGASAAVQLMRLRDKAALNRRATLLHEMGAVLLTPDSAGYPDSLRDLPDAPIALYAKGDVSLLGRPCVAIVGTREPTAYGQRVTARFAHALSQSGVCVVSGLAFGVDAIAHESALDAGGGTIAVLGCGLDVCYPAEHRALMQRVARHGLLLTEYTPGTRPTKYSFPERNRIIAGLSCGVIVPEAAEGSGSMITVGYAMEYGREVFTVPGNIDCAASFETNRLIGTSALAVLSPEDVLDALGLGTKAAGEGGEEKQDGADSVLDPEEAQVIACLSRGPLSADQLVEKTGFAASQLNSHLTMLEMQGIIVQSAGRIFSLV